MSESPPGLRSRPYNDGRSHTIHSKDLDLAKSVFTASALPAPSVARAWVSHISAHNVILKCRATRDDDWCRRRTSTRSSSIRRMPMFVEPRISTYRRRTYARSGGDRGMVRLREPRPAQSRSPKAAFTQILTLGSPLSLMNHPSAHNSHQHRRGEQIVHRTFEDVGVKDDEVRVKSFTQTPYLVFSATRPCRVG